MGVKLIFYQFHMVLTSFKARIASFIWFYANLLYVLYTDIWGPQTPWLRVRSDSFVHGECNHIQIVRSYIIDVLRNDNRLHQLILITFFAHKIRIWSHITQ